MNTREIAKATVPQVSIGAAIGLGITSLLLLSEWLFTRALEPFDILSWEGTYLHFGRYLPGAIVMAIVAVTFWRFRNSRAFSAGIAIGAIVAYVLSVSASSFDPLGLRASGSGAQFNLEESVPNPWFSEGHYVPLTQFSASKLNAAEQWWQVRRIFFVAGEVPSNEPSVVSVNIIDAFSWGAASLSSQTGRCNLILVVVDKNDPSHSDTFYGTLPPGSKCRGLLARRGNVTDRFWPVPD